MTLTPLIVDTVSTVLPGVANVGVKGATSAKTVTKASKAISKVSKKSANTVNRANKNAQSVAKNIGKVESAVADVGLAVVAAAAHQGVKAAAKDISPDISASDMERTSSRKENGAGGEG